MSENPGDNQAVAVNPFCAADVVEVLLARGGWRRILRWRVVTPESKARDGASGRRFCWGRRWRIARAGGFIGIGF